MGAYLMQVTGWDVDAVACFDCTPVPVDLLENVVSVCVNHVDVDFGEDLAGMLKSGVQCELLLPVDDVHVLELLLGNENEVHAAIDHAMKVVFRMGVEE